jgi:hypothetical protein
MQQAHQSATDTFARRRNPTNRRFVWGIT